MKSLDFNSSVIKWSSFWNNKHLFDTFGTPQLAFLSVGRSCFSK